MQRAIGGQRSSTHKDVSSSEHMLKSVTGYAEVGSFEPQCTGTVASTPMIRSLRAPRVGCGSFHRCPIVYEPNLIAHGSSRYHDRLSSTTGLTVSAIVRVSRCTPEIISQLCIFRLLNRVNREHLSKSCASDNGATNGSRALAREVLTS